MNDLIDRQAAIDALYKEIIKRRLLDDVNDGMLDEFDTEDMLRKLPSAQPEPSQVARDICTILENELDMRVILKNAQSEIIHCGDCRYKDDGIDEDGIPFLKCLNGRSYGGTRINDFCSWAERREE